MQRHFLIATVLLLCALFARAADNTPTTPPPPDELGQARALIEKKDWSAAAALLSDFTRANPGNADGFNLLGYSHRHLKRYDESLAAYRKALAIDPRHRGAHEYIGEAYIQLGQLDKAKEHLDALDRLCIFSCEEYRDLKKSYGAALQAQKK